MKCFSVLVLYLCMRTAYSYYATGPTDTTTPIGQTNEYSNYNYQQNINQASGQELQSSGSSSSVQNAYPSTQENIGGQLSSNQLEYRIGPGLPYPYQNIQTASEIQNIAQYNAVNNAAFSPQASAAQQIAWHPYLKDLYKTSIPTKRYTIVHPDGTIEHTDEIHSVTARYPKHIMVKAADILPYIDQANTYSTPTGPPQNIATEQVNKPITTTNQQLAVTSTNSDEKLQNNQFINNNGSPTDYFTPQTQNTVVESAYFPNSVNVVSSNPTSVNIQATKQNSQEIYPEASIIPVTESNSKEGQNNFSFIDGSQNNVVAANPLPLYSGTSNEVPVTNDQVSPIIAHSSSDAIASDSNIQYYSSNDVPNNLLTSTKPTNTFQTATELNNHEILPVILPEIQHTPQVIPEIATIEESITSNNANINKVDSNQTLPLILHEVLPKSTIQETQTTTDNIYQSEVTPGITTIEELITSNNIVNSGESNNNSYSSSKLAPVSLSNTVVNEGLSKDILDENVKSIATDIVSANTTNIGTVKDTFTSSDVKSNSTVPSVFNQSGNTNGAPLTWFHLPDESVWEAIRENASNVFFFFLPPKPKVYKEIRTTIYPNGTTIEEITETDVNSGPDGVPRVTKNVKILQS